MQRMVVFLFSKDAIIFCFFLLFAAGLWFIDKKDSSVTVRNAAEEQHIDGPAQKLKTLEVKIEATDVPAGERLQLIPSMTKVVVSVDTAYYHRLTASDIEATCAYPTHPTDSLVVNVKCTSGNARLESFDTKKVRYNIYGATK